MGHDSILNPTLEQDQKHCDNKEELPEAIVIEETINEVTKNEGEGMVNTKMENLSEGSSKTKETVASNRQLTKGKTGKAATNDKNRVAEINVSKELESFKKATIDVLQESFVNSFDQINNSIREMSCSQSDMEKLQAQVKMLTDANEKLKLQVGNSKNIQTIDKECSTCIDHMKRINSLSKDLESSKEKMKEDRYKHKLEEEIRESKFNAEISLLRRKEESMSRTISILETDISTFEKRLAVKSELILDLEQNISKLNAKITDLQDTIFETKCQSFDSGENFHEVVNSKNKVELTERDSVDKKREFRVITSDVSTEVKKHTTDGFERKSSGRGHGTNK